MAFDTFKVDAGPHARSYAPVTIGVAKGGLPDSARVIDSVTGASIPAQITRGDQNDSLTFIAEHLAKGETRVYRVEEVPSADYVLLNDEGGSIDVSIGGSAFTTFLYSKDHYRPHFYPVYGKGGKEVTETGASDHKHHRSVYVAYGEVNDVDLWAEGANSGRIVNESVESSSGAVFGSISTANSWQDKEGNVQMTDEQHWVIYNLPEDRRVIEATVIFKATHGDVLFTDTKEGGIMSARVAPTMKVSNTGTITNSFGGTNESETWGKRANWCDYSGYVDGAHLGIAIFDHIGNPRHPAHWHVRNYGLMTANIFGRGTFEKGGQLIDGDGKHLLKAGDSLTFRYQVVVHAGDSDDADLNGAYHNFVNPPKASAAE
ncbi:MAG: PmoA family protein [Candidatus Poribacteria bacterium]|nr:PmoA family protein [Candidatus Poribacteria bacterium]